jgi:hypothetical protein
MFEENEAHYKSLMEIYEEHMKECTSQNLSKRRLSINKVSEWKNLEKKNVALATMVRQFPAFTKIYKENLLLKQERKIGDDILPILHYEKIPTKRTAEETTFLGIKEPDLATQLDGPVF